MPVTSASAMLTWLIVSIRGSLRPQQAYCSLQLSAGKKLKLLTTMTSCKGDLLSESGNCRSWCQQELLNELGAVSSQYGGQYQGSIAEGADSRNPPPSRPFETLRHIWATCSSVVLVQESTDLEELGVFLNDSVAGGTEGLIIKSLDSTYEPSRRSSHWLKLKKDYMDSVGDTFDVVPIGAWHGK